MTIIIDDVASVAVQTLRDFKARFLISDQVQQFERDINTIHSFLKDTDRWSDQYNATSLRRWISDLEELGRKADDVLGRYHHLESSKRRRFLGIFRWCFCTPPNMHRVGSDIMSIRAEVERLSAKATTFSLGGSSSSAPAAGQQNLRLTYEVVEKERHFVGKEEDIKKLVSVVEEKNQTPVVLIWGMGGLGKTSLARKVFNHHQLKDRFETRVWVCVTRNFHPENILRDILEKFLPRGEISDMGIPELVVRLNKCLMETKCLVVLDDMWEAQHWDTIKSAFPIEGNKSSKFVLTSRNRNLISPDDVGCVHRLGTLTEDEGWELLSKIVLGDERVAREIETELESTGRDIVNKCSCVRLAISVVAGSMSEKRITPGEWMAVNDKSILICSGKPLERTTELKKILDLSFDALPRNLKSCFMSLACFADYKRIELREVYLMWNAQGLIPLEGRGNNESIKDVGYRYWNELLFRSMVENYNVEVGEGDGGLHGHLHDLMHRLCVSKGEEGRFIRLIDGQKRSYPPREKISRLAITSFDSDVGDYFIEKEDELNKGLLFLRIDGSKYDQMQKIHSEGCLTIFGKLQRLRTIILKDVELEGNILPSGIGKLCHLKHLALDNVEVKELPKSVCHLTNLQTLHLGGFSTVRVHNVLHKMKGLKHLILDNVGITVVGGDKLILDGLELETLSGFDSRFFCVEDINKLTRLEDLRASIHDFSSLSVVVDCMSHNRSHLLSTELAIFFGTWDLRLEGGLDTLRKMLSVHSLACLRIYGNFNCAFPSYQHGMGRNMVGLVMSDCADIQGNIIMETLGKFPVLKYLHLDSSKGVTEIILPPASFPTLTDLTIFSLFDLEKLVVGKGAMPSLSYFMINDCSKLEMIPDLRNNTLL